MISEPKGNRMCIDSVCKQCRLQPVQRVHVATMRTYRDLFSKSYQPYQLTFTTVILVMVHIFSTSLRCGILHKWGVGYMNILPKEALKARAKSNPTNQGGGGGGGGGGAGTPTHWQCAASLHCG